MRSETNQITNQSRVMREASQEPSNEGSATTLRRRYRNHPPPPSLCGQLFEPHLRTRDRLLAGLFVFGKRKGRRRRPFRVKLSPKGLVTSFHPCPASRRLRLPGSSPAARRRSPRW